MSLKICLASLLAASALASPALAAAPAKKAASSAPMVPPTVYTQRMLANGLKVIAIRDTTTPNVMVSMWYEVGSKHDPAGRSGFAHLFEHILSRKTVNMPYNSLNRMVDDIGGNRNASTWYDRTNYYEIVPAQYLERMLWTHAERMARPVIDKEVFETERNVVKEELRARVYTPPYGRLTSFALGENVYNVLPHRRPTIGSIADLDSATLEDARAFHEAYYGPDTGTLIVSGNFNPAELNRLIDRYFAAIPARKVKHSLAITTKDKPLTARVVNASGPNVTLPVMGFAWQMPGYGHPDFAVVEVLDAILSTGDHSRFHQALVEPGLATDTSTFLNSTEEQGFFAALGYVASGKSNQEVEQKVAATIASLRTTPPTADEVAEAKNELLFSSLFERETFSGRAFELGEALVRTGQPGFAEKRLAAIARVTPADVTRVARKYLSPSTALTVRYVNGDGNAAQWANPTPLPVFKTPPPATSKPLSLRAEGERDPLPGPGSEAVVQRPVPVESTLGNGVRLITAKTTTVPLVSMTMMFRGGSSVDPRGKAGRTGMAASIASKGTATRSAADIAVGLEKLGATMTEQVTSDGSAVTLVAPAATLAQAAEIMADVVRNATYPAAEFERERKRTLDGLSISLKDPAQLAARLLGPVVYGAAPYGNVSTPASIAGLTRDDLIDYRRTYWRPELATVIVTGGIDPARAREIAERSFGDWRVAGAAPTLAEERAGPPLPGRTVVVDLPGAGQAAVYVVARGLTRRDGSFYDAQIANSILGGSSTGRLFEEIRVKRALSYGSYSSLGANFDEGMFSASAQTKNETAAEVAKILIDELNRIARDPLDPAAVTSRQTLLKGNFRTQTQTGLGMNSTFLSSLARGIEPAEALAYPDRIDATTGAKATAAMARLLRPDNVSLVIVGDSAKFIDKLRQLRPGIEVIPADKLDLATATKRP